ncbi:hypothetical protein CLV98_11046 [Dyadobacter jejuensis]|uniref:Uncharacterized protein n=1 Tax=Dyadobacter jejuensis TaxID=1082580 RepID=A0A316AG21_9BACT|nr:hypothetical protein CLV98_11046 [Dyadobacter jejuensis]
MLQKSDQVLPGRFLMRELSYYFIREALQQGAAWF